MCTQKATFSTHVYFCILWIGLLVCFPTVVMGVEEPNDMPVGTCSSTSVVFSEARQDCWEEVFRANSKDATAYEMAQQLIVELDGCQVVSSEITEIPQNTPNPESVDLEPDDLVIVWDEDDSHGSGYTSRAFTFTDTNGQENETGFVADLDCEYVRVSSTDDEVINWMVYRILESGTVTVTTGQNEHVLIHLQRNLLDFTKVADANECVSPKETFTYTICYTNDTDVTYENAFVIDWLPEKVDYPAGEDHYVFNGTSPIFVEGDDGYSGREEGHYYVWNLGTIAPGDANCLTLEVQVSEYVEPGHILHNVAELLADDGDTLVARDVNDLAVCCWQDDPSIIYVDQEAKGHNIGTNWKDAYTDLADALRRATETDCSDSFKIYVAQGTYDPNETDNLSFVLPDNCSVYGGFPTGGCNFEDRNPKKYETILTGLIDDDSIPDVDVLVEMGNDSLLDGFTVTETIFPNGYCIYGSNVDFELTRCTITESGGYGVYAKDGNVSVQWCTISLNNSDGLYHTGNEHTLSVDNSWLLRNGEFGILSEKTTPVLRNSIISESSLKEASWAGVRMVDPPGHPKVYNCTIANNNAEGISFTHSDPNYFKRADRLEIQNSILYFNNDNKNQLAGLNPDKVAYFSCIADCNDANFNVDVNPGFAYTIDPNGTPDPNNYHLGSESLLKDAGNPDLIYAYQIDMDTEWRVVGDCVDIGADELYSCDGDYTEDDFYNSADRNADGVVNYAEFLAFSTSWLSRDPNDPSLPNDPNLIDPNDFTYWNPRCDLNDNYTVDLPDIISFVDDSPWLWKACWRENYVAVYGVTSGSTESMAAQPLAMSAVKSSLSSYSLETETSTESVGESGASIDTLVQIIGFLDYEVIPEQPDNIEKVEEMRGILMDDLMEAWLRENE